MIAERLIKSRKEAGLTQVQLAGKLSVSKGTVAMWETGKRVPNLNTFVRLGEVLNKRPEYLCGFVDESPREIVIKIEGGRGYEVICIYG